ncbi:hypothetical protein J7337_009951 [Fusarium musae]|uniref:LSM domain-containing protein n=1 Tax=Fusarium musae TaxID=1042133 RepID=A0A9P8DC24_9HYPO|nr:hypothetical protein J7337_009951 [Fusarium musae]KAG9499138.1 hypothetical protein J7337_009951 [Fusarium musae]
MENLSIADASPQGRGAPQPLPQLPPQMFTTAAQLLDLTDTNLVLQSTVERIFAPSPESAGSDRPTGLYADINHGIFLVRGENVLLLGEIDLDRDDDPPPGFEPGDLDVVKKLAEEKKAVDKAREKARVKKLAKQGFEGENIGEIVL